MRTRTRKGGGASRGGASPTRLPALFSLAQLGSPPPLPKHTQPLGLDSLPPACSFLGACGSELPPTQFCPPSSPRRRHAVLTPWSNSSRHSAPPSLAPSVAPGRPTSWESLDVARGGAGGGGGLCLRTPPLPGARYTKLPFLLLQAAPLPPVSQSLNFPPAIPQEKETIQRNRKLIP